MRLAAIVRLPRETFLTRFWDYQAGEHVTFIAPTGAGKTTLGFQLLDETATPDLPALVLAMKPKDSTVDHFRKEAGFRLVRTWPPVPSPFHPVKPRGWVLWPKHTFKPREDNDRIGEMFERAVLDSYKRGRRIVFADELYSLAHELDLDEELNTVWTKGRSMGCGLWGATQRPAHVPLYAYGQATHLFLSWDPDKRSRDRYREISGMDPALIYSALDQLEPFEWVYVKRAGRSSTICIVES